MTITSVKIKYIQRFDGNEYIFHLSFSVIFYRSFVMSIYRPSIHIYFKPKKRTKAVSKVIVNCHSLESQTKFIPIAVENLRKGFGHKWRSECEGFSPVPKKKKCFFFYQEGIKDIKRSDSKEKSHCW